jgi:hypothetical protein
LFSLYLVSEDMYLGEWVSVEEPRRPREERVRGRFVDFVDVGSCSSENIFRIVDENSKDAVLCLGDCQVGFLGGKPTLWGSIQKERPSFRLTATS